MSRAGILTHDGDRSDPGRVEGREALVPGWWLRDSPGERGGPFVATQTRDTSIS